MDGSQLNRDRTIQLAVFELDSLNYGKVCAFVESMGEDATVWAPGIRITRMETSNRSDPIPVNYAVVHHRVTITDATNRLRVVGNQIWTAKDAPLVEGRLRAQNIEYHMAHINTRTSEADTRLEVFPIADSWEVHYRGRKL